MNQILLGARAFPSLLRVGFASMVAYRSELMIWFLTAILPVLMMLIWDRAAEAGPIGRFDQNQFTRYFTCGLVIRQMTSAWVIWTLNFRIRTGQLNPALLKPLSPLIYPAAENMAALPFRILVLAPVILLIWWWRPGMGFGLEPLWLPVLALSIFMGWLLNYCIQVAIGSLAFFSAARKGFSWGGTASGRFCPAIFILWSCCLRDCRRW
ncbi:MAG: hypothetical protein DWQ01_17505 [Planctomycetota bacterium]|nr:MAG: hypothetical protein DWQ01_17505 [Planctomycetota bacterium]